MTQETEKKATQTGETKETTKIRKEDNKSNKTELQEHDLWRTKNKK